MRESRSARRPVEVGAKPCLRRIQTNELGRTEEEQGAQVKLAPPVCHLNDFGESLLPTPDETWVIVSIQDDTVLLSAPSGHSIRLAKEHICNSVPGSPRDDQANDPISCGCWCRCSLGATNTWVRPNSKPGAPVEPPVDLARKREQLRFRTWSGPLDGRSRSWIAYSSISQTSYMAVHPTLLTLGKPSGPLSRLCEPRSPLS